MRPQPTDAIEAGRHLGGQFATPRHLNCGMFDVMGPKGEFLRIVVSDGQPVSASPEDLALAGWEHVSVSTQRRCPNWPEMCWVKDQFWGEEEFVVQLHPPRSLWISNHPYCLHLWRPLDGHIRMPPSFLVGVQSEGEFRDWEHAKQVAAKHGAFR